MVFGKNKQDLETDYFMIIRLVSRCSLDITVTLRSQVPSTKNKNAYTERTDQLWNPNIWSFSLKLKKLKRLQHESNKSPLFKC